MNFLGRKKSIDIFSTGLILPKNLGDFTEKTLIVTCPSFSFLFLDWYIHETINIFDEQVERWGVIEASFSKVEVDSSNFSRFENFQEMVCEMMWVRGGVVCGSSASKFPMT